MKNSENILTRLPIALSIAALLISIGSWYDTHQQKELDVWLALTVEEYLERGNNYLEEGNYWEAIRNYDKALEIMSDDPNPNVLKNKGYALINLGIDNESITVTRYSDAKKFINYSFTVYKNQSAAASQHYFERAFLCFKEAKVSEPEDPEIVFYYAALGLYFPITCTDPVEGFNETINIINNLLTYRQEQYPVKFIKRSAWYGMCVAYKERGEEEKAEECFQKVKRKS